MAAVGAGSCVLVVDDSVTIRTMVRDLLAGRGYRVLTAGDGGEAVRIYREHPGAIAAVILDEQMPVMGGHETLRALRAIDPGVRAICMSGGCGAATDGPEPGFQSRVPKPFKIAALLAEVERLIAQPRP